MSMKTTVLKCPVDLCDIDSAVEKANCAIKENKTFHIVTINPEMIMNAQKNRHFFEILNNSDLNIIDGVGVKIALKFQKINPPLVRGVDFSRALVDLASKENYKIGFLGAKEEIINLAVKNFKEKYPGLNFVYVRNGYFDNDDEIIDEISKTSVQILLVGLGSPRQEEFIVKLKNKLQGCVLVGVGGSFDVFSGLVKESPLIFRKLGLEWLFRTLCEPKRLKRIFPVLPLFLIKCIIETITNKGLKIEN